MYTLAPADLVRGAGLTTHNDLHPCSRELAEQTAKKTLLLCYVNARSILGQLDEGDALVVVYSMGLWERLS